MKTAAIAIALYNGERFINEQLTSLLNQSRPADQIVLCDDRSSDHTVELVKEFIQKNDLNGTWSLYENKKNIGYVKNFYKAIELCETDIVFLCDQDDVWNTDKIEKMTDVMMANENIMLLSCKCGFIDSSDKEIKKSLSKNQKETMDVVPITIADILRSFIWKGMTMCIRKDFFMRTKKYIYNLNIPHDVAVAILAAETGQFYEMDYIGAYHRSHGNNTAMGEHKISKLLNLDRKINEFDGYNKMLTNIINAELPISNDTMKLLKLRLEYSISRKKAVENKNLKALIKLYKNDTMKILRIKSFVCDILLVLFR